MRQQIHNRPVFTAFVYVFYRKKLLHQTDFFFFSVCLPVAILPSSSTPQVGRLTDWHANRAATQEEKPGRSYRTQQLFCCSALFIIHLIWKTDCKPTAQLSSSNKARAQIIHDAAKKLQQDERGENNSKRHPRGGWQAGRARQESPPLWALLPGNDRMLENFSFPSTWSTHSKTVPPHRVREKDVSTRI